jgi:hypothetical protein
MMPHQHSTSSSTSQPGHAAANAAAPAGIARSSSSFKQSNIGSTSSTATRATSGGIAAAPPAGSSDGSSGSNGGSNAVVTGSIKLYAVVDAAAASPFRSHSPKGSKGLDWSANWGDVLQHMAQRLTWTDPRFNLQVCVFLCVIVRVASGGEGGG